MSPTDAKRGAKRRKNKRGGGSSSCSSAVCSSGKAGASTAARSQQTTGASAAAMGLLTVGNPGSSNPGSITGLHGEVSLNGTQFSDMPLNSEFAGVPQTPFTFGLSQRAPYTTEERCLLCRSERKENSFSESGTSSSNKIALSTSPKTNSILQLPLWVCPDCRHTVEKEERHAELEQSLVNQDFLLHMPLGNSGSPGGRLSLGAQVATPDLHTPATTDTVCSCEACNERREISAESEREPQQLQNYWSEVRYMVRCIYRQTGITLADDQEQSLVPDKEGMKELVDRLCEKDPYQLYQRLEQQAREYVLEMKVRLLRHLSVGSKVTSAVQGPPQAHQFISLLLEEYSALCQAAHTISTFLVTLENEHLKKFQVTWELHNKHLFENLVFSEPLLHNCLPTLVAQLRLGMASHDSYSEDMYSTLLQSYHQLDQEMNLVSVEWLECEKRIDDYVDEQMALKTKQHMLKEDWEFFKQRRFIEEQLTNSKKSLPGENNFTDTMRHMLSSRLSMSDCPNCNYRHRCTCDDCSLSHILTCGIMDSPITDDLHINQLPLQVESAPDYLSEIRPPSMSSASSGSGSSSPITIQQHPRLILADSGSAPTFCSDDDDDDDDVPPLSAKFADIYPVNNYDDAEVVANMNGMHGELNGGGENMALKDESPQVSSTSSCSSEADDDEADGESSGESLTPGKIALMKDDLERDSPPPSYPTQQVDQVQHACECHVCKQEAAGLNAAALSLGRHPSGHQFLTKKTSHPALHLYPHIHGHLPLHNISHLPRPLLHPTLYSSPPFSHNKTLPSAPTSNHTGKHQVFNASLQDHIYQNCFGNTTDWNSSLPPSLKFENLWESTVMKNWNPAIFLQEPESGDMLGPAVPEIRPDTLPPSSSTETTSTTESKEKKNPAKKKCLYNFQDAFMEPNKVVMATSSATSSVSCTATTVQSSNNQIKVSSKRPASLGEVFHNIGKEDHRHSTPTAPRSSPTGLASLPSLTATALSPASAPHLPNLGTQHFPKTAATAPGFMDPHQGLCPTTVVLPAAATENFVSAPPSVCSDPDCEGHRCESNNVYDHQQYDGEESQDEDSCSEHSSSTSTSTNQKEGKYCDCCYCEFFGHGGPPAAPTSRNYAEMREKLRLRLTKRKEEQPKKDDPLSDREGVEDHRKVEDLLQFINSSESKPVNSSRAAKRARHKQKKMEEKARLDAEALEREQQQILEEKRRREEEERLKQELQRLQERQLLRAAKKKKKEKMREALKTAPVLQNPQPLKETAQNALVNLQNGKLQSWDKIINLPCSPIRPAFNKEQRTVPEPFVTKQNLGNEKDFKQPQLSHSQKEGKVKQPEMLVPPHTVPHREVNCKPKLKQQLSKLVTEAGKQPAEATKVTDIQLKTANKIQVELKLKPAEDLPDQELKKEEKVNVTNGKKQLNHVKEDKPMVIIESAPQSEQQQNNKPNTAESPQPKGKTKKNKKKKGDKLNNSIDDVFLPKDIDLDSVEMDETEREVEYFKRFCLDSARQTRQRLSINWSNFSLKKATFVAH
ncbi:protein FAM193A-like isoform X2 [Acipenser oxyrinchus oxyrinchus]|uniref:Protein FAM193A-like isoform X2 n=1 Tax=Acipenser oxyrinchus oxyrinchus TaxID=40147 RepID=A0AAD8LUS9_ACIOX|nr:protein FAM193A-like isoform X2 [Acipenser oxyrinchus oxyrinchus]